MVTSVTSRRPFASVSPETYRAYVLVALVCVGALAWIDRNIISVVLQSIKESLSLSDTQLGLIGGTAFGLFYAICGLPVAWLADRVDRRLLMTAAISAWSLMTVACGAAGTFISMFMARAGVAIGESGGAPPSHSMIADYYPTHRRGFAFGVLYLYIPLGALVGFTLGGWLNETFGWRLAFAFVGVPGLLVALVIWRTVFDPRRGVASSDPSIRTVAFWSSIRSFAANRTLRHIPFAGSIYGIALFAVTVWLPAHLARLHGLSSSEIGLWMGAGFGICGGIGTVLGGYVADTVAQRTNDLRWYAWLPAATIGLAAIFFATIFLAPLWIGFICLMMATLVGHMYLGPLTAMIQGVTPSEKRSMASAYYLFFSNIIGVGIGPLLIGIVSDRFSELGSDSLRYSLLAVVPTACALSALYFLLIARTIREDMR